MKRILIAAFVAIMVLAVAAFSVTPVQAGNINNNPGKSWICHHTSDNAEHQWQAQEVSNASLPAHWSHGDFYYNGPEAWLPQPGNQGISLADGWCENNVPQPTATSTVVPTVTLTPTPTWQPTSTPTVVPTVVTVTTTPPAPTWQPTATFPPVGTPQVPSTGGGEEYPWWVPILARFVWPGTGILLGLIAMMAAGLVLATIELRRRRRSGK